MAGEERIRKYVEAATMLGEVSRRRAEELVRALVDAGSVQRSHANQWAESLASQVGDVLKRSADVGLSATREVSAQAGRTADGVRGTAGRTASRARAAASRVTPAWAPGPGGTPPEKAAS